MPKDAAKSVDDIPKSPQESQKSEIGSVIEFLCDWNAEITRFYMHRYHQYWLLPWRLQTLESPNDLHVLQADFQRKLVSDYRQLSFSLTRIVDAVVKESAMAPDQSYATSLLNAQRDAAAIIEQAKSQAERILASAEGHAAAMRQEPKSGPAAKRA